MKVSLSDIRDAREIIKSVIKRTELDHSSSASKILGSDVYFKFENQQLTGSFKLRGALNKIAHLKSELSD
jgi:threonine dehydratase